MMNKAPDITNRWRAGQTVHVDGIAFRTGRVVLLEVKTYCIGTTIKCVASPMADTTLDSILSYDEDPWVEFTSLCAVTWDGDLRVSCGEGAMGNEGFVAFGADSSSVYDWVPFCTSSNPFTHLDRDGEHILAHAGYDQVWRIPFINPEAFTIV